jgi:hypothetical protein
VASQWPYRLLFGLWVNSSKYSRGLGLGKLTFLLCMLFTHFRILFISFSRVFFVCVISCGANRINRPGGHGKITGVHCDEEGVVESLDVKYTITGGFDKQIDPDLCKHHQELERTGRQRRTREVFTVPVEEKENETKATKKKDAAKKSKVEKKEKPAKVSTQAEKPKTNKSKKRKKAVTNDASEVQSDQETDSIPTEIHIPLLSPERVSASARFTSPLTESGVESRPVRKYMLDNDAVDAQHDELLTPPCSPASDVKSCVRESPISRVKSLGRGDFVDIPETKKTKGACLQAAHGPRVKVTLREVYDDHWQEANEFVKDVVTDSKAKQPSPSKKEEEISKAPELPEVDERQSAFLAVFNDLLQNNDGTIEEEGLLSKINELSTKRVKNGMTFAEAEVDQILLHLCEENKIMRCDGQVYSI